MKKIKLLLDPNDVELISDALNTCFDTDSVHDDDMETFENLCQMFNILRSTGKCLKVATVKNCDCEYCECVHDDAEDDGFIDDDEGCLEDDERDDKAWPADEDKDCWDVDEDDDNDPDAIDIDEEDKSNAWNANTPWTTE